MNLYLIPVSRKIVRNNQQFLIHVDRPMSMREIDNFIKESAVFKTLTSSVVTLGVHQTADDPYNTVHCAKLLYAYQHSILYRNVRKILERSF